MTTAEGQENDGGAREPAPALVAVDFTADELRVVLATPAQEVIASERYALPELADEEAWSWEVGGRISTLFARDEPLFALGIGIACPGAVHSVHGVMTESRAQDGWDELHVVDAIRRHIDAPVVAIDRVHAALRGEITVGAALDVNDAIYVTFREPAPVAATLAAGTVVRGAHHRPGFIEDDDALAAIAASAALLDTAVVILDAPQEEADGLSEALHEALETSGCDASVVVSELGASAPLFGALEAASIVAYEGERARLDQGDDE
jgi:hypothetical protein